MPEIIEFYADTPIYNVFSNFHIGQPIFFEGKYWPTSEHYYQAMKFSENSPISDEYINLMRQADTVNKMYVLAQQSAFGYKSNWALVKGDTNRKLGDLIKKYKNLGVKPRPDWDLVKDQIMYNIVTAKFEQDPKLKEILLNTGDKILVEHTLRDKYWGDGGFCGNGIPEVDKGGTMKGLNKLGNILMRVRDELRRELSISDQESKQKKQLVKKTLVKKPLVKKKQINVST